MQHVDGDNRLLWRMNARRLDAEAWRDSLLAATGELDRSLGGEPTQSLLESNRRTLYSVISRNGDKFESDRFLHLFDLPSARSTCPKRDVSIVPQQFLFMLNSKFMEDRAAALAARVQREKPDDDARIRLAYELLYCRPPDAEETQAGIAFPTSAPKPLGNRERAVGKRYAGIDVRE